MTGISLASPRAPRSMGPGEPCWCGSGTKYKKCHREADEVAARSRSAGVPGKRVLPGRISPRREVPAAIVRPPYAATGRPPPDASPDVKSGERLERLRHVCRLAADVLEEAGRFVRPGLTTDEIDAFVHDACLRRGAYPSPLGYHGFPKSVCTSVNEVICHGIPDDRVLEDGDIINLDVTLYLGGMHGDCNATFLVGNVDAESQRLVQVTRECLEQGISAIQPGLPIHVIGSAIERHAKASGMSVVRAYCGHGIGEQFHSGLQIPHVFDPEATTVMVPGLVFTIEPMVALGGWRHIVWPDKWTALTADGKRTAQFEHTLVVTGSGAEILTLPSLGKER